jgi:nucleolar complex protein 2
LIAYKQTPEILQHYAPIVEKKGRLTVAAQSQQMPQILPLLKTLFSSTITLLPSLSSSPATLLVLSQTEKLLPYIVSFRKHMRHLIHAVLDLWSKPSRQTKEDENGGSKPKSEEDDSFKMAAFLWIRKVMIIGDLSLQENCLKVPNV